MSSSRRPIALLYALCQIALILSAPPEAHSHPSADTRLRAVDRQLSETPSANLYVERGKANLQAGRWQEALGDADRALTLHPGLIDALLLRAEVRYTAGEVDQALTAVDALLAAQPQSAAGHHLRARVLRELGRLAEAEIEYDSFIDGERQALPDHYIERADVQAAAGRLDAAVSGIDAGLTRLGMIATLQLKAVDLEVRRGNFNGAVGRLDRLLERSPRQVFWLVRRAEVLAAAGNVDESRATFESARALLPSPTRVGALRELQERIDVGLSSLPVEIVHGDAK